MSHYTDVLHSDISLLDSSSSLSWLGGRIVLAICEEGTNSLHHLRMRLCEAKFTVLVMFTGFLRWRQLGLSCSLSLACRSKPRQPNTSFFPWRAHAFRFVAAFLRGRIIATMTAQLADSARKENCITLDPRSAA